MTMFDVSLYLALLLGLMGCLRSNDYNTTNYYFFKSKSFINISQRKQEKDKIICKRKENKTKHPCSKEEKHFQASRRSFWCM